ncbi:hypothetical protein BD770DRAFT_393228 [Pilaira anomala]|nr:hypothetical protein BD770DRAFT_393228 [Pilaira anomala]
MSNNRQAHYWSELPAEILHYALNKIDDKKTIIQCLYVCKSWRISAERIIYNTLNFTSYEPQLQKFVITVASAKHLGKHVKKIHFSKIFNANGPWDPANLFSGISDYCPNVQTMTTAESCPSLWLRLIVERHKWKKLKKIPVPNTWDEVQLYATVALAYRDRLTELLILNDPEDSIQLRKMYNPLISNLSEFKSLTELKLHKANNVKIYEIDDLINECPKLVSLILPYTPPTTDEPSLLTATAPRFSTKILDEIKLMKPKHNLKELSMNVSIDGGDESLNYIMHVFPNLTNIEFNKDICTFDINQNIIYSKSVLTSFLRYVTNKDKKYDIQYLYSDDIATVLSNYWQSEEFKAKGRGAYLTLNDANFSLDADRPFLKVKETIGASVWYRSLEDSPTAPELLEKVGGLLSNMQIKLVKIVPENQQDVENLYRGYILDSIFEHCPYLFSLECCLRELKHCRPDLAVNTSITVLKLAHSGINLDVLYQLSIRLPNLNYLSLLGNKYLKHSGAEYKGKRLLINMPYTDLKQLNICKESSKSYQYVYLKYSTENGDKYFFVDCTSTLRRATKCSHEQYESKLNDKGCYFVNLRFKRIDTLRFELGTLQFIHWFNNE